ncbi:hypothetical protein DFH27DRAFT_531641 [Peziza echinospora]|nr:hypothetical protein DFH27DRAFT_531641 [Peziza echinospora]
MYIINVIVFITYSTNTIRIHSLLLSRSSPTSSIYQSSLFPIFWLTTVLLIQYSALCTRLDHSTTVMYDRYR